MSNGSVRAIAITSTTLLFALIGLMAWGWTHGEASPPSSIYSVKLDCPSGTTEYTSLGNGGEWTGWLRTCVQNHGPIYVWRDEKLVYKGTFVNGKQKASLLSTTCKDGLSERADTSMDVQFSTTTRLAKEVIADIVRDHKAQNA
jgi:hypothetical protein